MGLLTKLKVVGVRIALLYVGILYSFFIIWVLPILWLLRGNKLFSKKKRQTEPDCLRDRKYGRHHLIQLSEIRMHYVENGDRKNPLMLFVHGFPEFWYSWRHQMTHFASTHWVVAVDMRGYGDTDKPSERSSYIVEKLEKDICDLIIALKKEKCILVAHDWGGIIAWNVASHNPHLIDQLIIMNAPIIPSVRHKIWTSFEQVIKSWYTCFFQVPFVPEFGCQVNDMELFHWIFLNENKEMFVRGEDLEAYKYTFGKKGAFTTPINYYRENMFRFLVSDGTNKFPKIHIPTLVIWGEDDVALCRDYPTLAGHFVSNLTVRYIPKGNHFIQQDKPEIVNGHMQEFLKIKPKNKKSRIPTTTEVRE